MRIHEPNTEATPNAPARNEDVLCIARKELLADPTPKAQGKGTFQGDADGVWYKESFLKTASDGDKIDDPAADAAAIQTHIPAAGMVVP